MHIGCPPHLGSKLCQRHPVIVIPNSYLAQVTNFPLFRLPIAYQDMDKSHTKAAKQQQSMANYPWALFCQHLGHGSVHPSASATGAAPFLYWSSRSASVHGRGHSVLPYFPTRLPLHTRRYQITTEVAGLRTYHMHTANAPYGPFQARLPHP